MRTFRPARPLRRALILVASTAVLSLAFATSVGVAAVPATGATAEIDIKFVKGKLFFEGPATVTQGDELEIVNETNPKQVGPHSFSLVTKGSLPKTPNARKNCFTPKHICLSVAKWHGFNPKTEQISINPAKAGLAGWSTMGSTSKKGDSWFTEKKGESFGQQVSAEPGPLYYFCAVHPWMQGKVDVVAPTPLPIATP